MEIVSKILTEAFQDNLQYAILMDMVIGLLFLFDIILGTIIGTNEEGFDVKKFLFGFVKAIALMLIILGVCYVLNVFVLTINVVEGIEISVEVVGTLEVLAILIAQGIDIAKDILEKIKSIRDLKYIKYDDVVVVDYNGEDGQG